MNTVEDILAGNAKSFSFENIGDTCKGRITKAEVKQQTDMDTGEPKTFADGSPMNQIVITIEQDDGEEAAVYIKGGRYEVEEGKGKSALDALRGALNGQQLTVGGTIAVQFSGLGKKKNKGWSAPKLFTIEYRPPAPPSIDVGESLI